MNKKTLYTVLRDGEALATIRAITVEDAARIYARQTHGDSATARQINNQANSLSTFQAYCPISVSIGESFQVEKKGMP